MNNLSQKYALILLFIFGSSSLSYSQSNYSIVDTEDINIWLNGTSSLHDWEMVASSVKGKANFYFNTENQIDLESIDSLLFSLKVKDLKADNKKLTKNAHKSLKSGDYKDIQYLLFTDTLSVDENGYLVKTHGNLTIADITNEIAMDVYCTVNDDSTITCKGTKILNMTNFGIEPPSFLFGAMKTGEQINIDFEVIFKNDVDI